MKVTFVTPLVERNVNIQMTPSQALKLKVLTGIVGGSDERGFTITSKAHEFSVDEICDVLSDLWNVLKAIN